MITKNIWTLFRNFHASERGNFSVELGLSSLFLLPMLAGLLHYAGVIQQTMQLRQAARAGVEYAITYPSDVTGITQAVTSSSAIDSTGMAVDVNLFCECPNGTSVSCTSTCASGGPGDGYIRVTVTQPPHLYLQFFDFAPGSVLTGMAVMRVR